MPPPSLAGPPPAQRPAPAPRRESFVTRVRGAFTGKSTTTIVWLARIILAKDGEIVIELTVAGGTLAWSPSPEAVLYDASSTRLAVDLAKTTRAGTYESGAVVRFVLQVPPGFDANSLGEMGVGGVHVKIER